MVADEVAVVDVVIVVSVEDVAVTAVFTATEPCLLAGNMKKLGSLPVKTLNRFAHSDSSVTRSKPGLARRLAAARFPPPRLPR